jgi:hypothetical protein
MKVNSVISKIIMSVFFIHVMMLNISCTNEHSSKEEREAHQSEEGGGEGGEGEEGGVRYTTSQSVNETKRGVNLILKYDKASENFVGTIKNISEKTVEKARVEVHLSNGIELGPTKRTNLKPGEQVDVKLPAIGQEFEWWSTHAEVGDSEEGHGEEGEGEHGRKGEKEGEHN